MELILQSAIQAYTKAKVLDDAHNGVFFVKGAIEEIQVLIRGRNEGFSLVA